ncbi:hypothetical protein [Flammeovirga aprica]|uniref:Uncharacterized protein n=1 Tax=Flammeovirga aprica JL-4 TaxID=694437 RepID=A0A7X9XDL1_9BACT|nr:hypothetical protein [Flammeovirga aprica]NME72764.1 hypothetical protein [Flammeovirga aprica JL-4]
MKRTLIHLGLFICLGVFAPNLFSQDYPIQQNDYTSEIRDVILKDRKLNDYDFILLKYAESYWFDKTEYKLVCFSKKNVDLIKITKKKKNNRLKVGQKKQAKLKSANQLLDSLEQLGLFDLKKSDLHTDLVIDNDTREVLFISDGIVETFEIYGNKSNWGLSVYEAIRHYKFCGNEDLLLFYDACQLFDKKWKKLN